MNRILMVLLWTYHELAGAFAGNDYLFDLSESPDDNSVAVQRRAVFHIQ